MINKFSKLIEWMWVYILLVYSDLTKVNKQISSGGAYGFNIGDNQAVSREKAESMLKKRKITSIDSWPEVQASNSKGDGLRRAFITVSPTNYIDKIELVFEDDALILIGRTRCRVELP